MGAHQNAPFFRINVMAKDSDPRQFKLIKPPSGLLEKIISRIQKESEILSIKKRIAVFFLGMLIALLGLGLSFNYMQAEFVSSGFLHYISLIFSDFGYVLNYWVDFSATILENLPVFSIAVFLVASLVLFILATLTARNIKVVLLSSKIIN